MKISTKGRYAMRMLLNLAEHQNFGYIALKDIASPKSIWSRLFRFLTDLGFLKQTEDHRAVIS